MSSSLSTASPVDAGTLCQANPTTVNIAPQALPCPVRESMRGAPQWFFTWLSGKPRFSEASWNLSPTHHLLSAAIPLAIGVTGAFWMWSLAGWWLLSLPVFWLLALHGSRKLRTCIMHQCSHGNYLGQRNFDRFLGEAISILVVSESFDTYVREHVAYHHSSHHTTIEDPTVAFLVKRMGLRPGMPVRTMWWRLLGTCLSPTYRIRGWIGRVRSNLFEASPVHTGVFLVYVVGVLTALAITGAWIPFLVAVFIPLGIFFQMSTAVRLSSEHTFPAKIPTKRDRSTIAGYTVGIFIGEQAPDPSLPWQKAVPAWIGWGVKMTFYHLPCRLGFLPMDGPCHDWHHRFPKSPDWPNYIHAREQDRQNGHPGWPPYTEVWGLHTAIQACFETLSKADPDDYKV